MIHLYQLYKDNHTVHIFGTINNCQLNNLPKSAIKWIMQHKGIITESIEFLKPITREQLVQYNFLRDKNISPFENLSNIQSTKIKESIDRYFKFKNCKDIDINQITNKGLFYIFEQASHMDGMDYGILLNFKNANKTIAGLETRDELIVFFEETSSEDLKQAVDRSIKLESENKDRGGIKKQDR